MCPEVNGGEGNESREWTLVFGRFDLKCKGIETGTSG